MSSWEALREIVRYGDSNRLPVLSWTVLKGVVVGIAVSGFHGTRESIELWAAHLGIPVRQFTTPDGTVRLWADFTWDRGLTRAHVQIEAEVYGGAS